MKIRINFASREYVFAWKVYASMLAVLALCVSAFFYGYAKHSSDAGRAREFAARVAQQEKRGEDIGKRLSEIRKTVNEEEVRASVQQAQFANQAIARRVFSWTAFLNRLEGVVPEGVGINAISPNFESLNVSIAGTALSMGQVTEFISRLTNSPYFEDIPPVFHASEVVADKDIGKNIYVFNLQIKYDPEGVKK